MEKYYVSISRTEREARQKPCTKSNLINQIISDCSGAITFIGELVAVMAVFLILAAYWIATP